MMDVIATFHGNISEEYLTLCLIDKSFTEEWIFKVSKAKLAILNFGRPFQAEWVEHVKHTGISEHGWVVTDMKKGRVWSKYF